MLTLSDAGDPAAEAFQCTDSSQRFFRLHLRGDVFHDRNQVGRRALGVAELGADIGHRLLDVGQIDDAARYREQLVAACEGPPPPEESLAAILPSPRRYNASSPGPYVRRRASRVQASPSARARAGAAARSPGRWTSSVIGGAS